MDCETIRKKLAEQMEGLLPKDEAARVIEHLASCTECREEYEELLKTVEHLKNLEEIEPPGWLTSKVMAKVREDADKAKRGWRAIFRPLPVKLPLGAAATVLIVIAALYIYRVNQSVTTILPARHAETLEQPAGEGNGSEHGLPEGATKSEKMKKKQRALPALRQAAPAGTSVRFADEAPSKGTATEEPGRIGNIPAPPAPSVESETRPALNEESSSSQKVYHMAAEGGGKASAPASIGSTAAPVAHMQKAERKDAGLSKEAANRRATIAGITVSDLQIKDLLEEEMRQRLDAVDACYEKGRGKVDVTFVITAGGGTQKQRVTKDGTGDEAGTKCLVGEIKKWHFSFGGAGIKVSATFDIRPQQIP